MTATAPLQKLALPDLRSISGVVDLPGSKSLSNRVLLLASLCGEGDTTHIENLLDSDDVTVMISALKALGIDVTRDKGEMEAVVKGCGGNYPVRSVGLDLGNAGTAMRPLTAALALQDGAGKYVLDGTQRMRERPIKDLVDALEKLGAGISIPGTGCPPVTIKTQPGGLSNEAGLRTSIKGDVSSQYLSALLMAAPLSNVDVTIDVIGELISIPYVKMTINLMRKFGITVIVDSKFSTFKIGGKQAYKSPAGKFYVEGDASSASYFLGAGAISGREVTVRGCGEDSIQGDIRFAEILGEMGADITWTPTSITASRRADKVLRGVDVDCGDIPDAAMSLASVALFAEGATTIRNVYSWRVKETERMVAIVTELRKLGATVEEGTDYCVITPPDKINANVEITTYDDHRMAMVFSLVSTGGVPVTILDPSVTRKTFPTYFDELSRLSSVEL